MRATRRAKSAGRKRGPKPKIGPAEEKRVYAVLEAGGSLNDAADVLGVARRTLAYHKAAGGKFCSGVDRAAAKGKVRLLKKVGKAAAWQAAAWMLERKWGSEFGKRDTLRHVGPDGEGPVKSETKHSFDHGEFGRLFERAGGTAGVGGDGHPPAPVDRN